MRESLRRIRITQISPRIAGAEVVDRDDDDATVPMMLECDGLGVGFGFVDVGFATAGGGWP